MRALLTLFALTSLPTLAAGLNDTGVTQCLNAIGNSLEACAPANAGDTAPYPRQDARFGRDAAQTAGSLSAKIGGGAAGFDFTPLDASGNAIAITGGVPASTPSCVRDNVTGLVWEGKTAANMNDIYNFAEAATYAGAANTNGLCGANGGWRLPTRRELLSIVHYGTSNPAIDSDYFPNTASSGYWSSDLLALDQGAAWGIVFDSGNTNFFQADYHLVRLVRSGQ